MAQFDALVILILHGSTMHCSHCFSPISLRRQCCNIPFSPLLFPILLPSRRPQRRRIPRKLCRQIEPNAAAAASRKTKVNDHRQNFPNEEENCERVFAKAPFSLSRKRLPKNVKRFGYQGMLRYHFDYLLVGFLKSYLYI